MDVLRWITGRRTPQRAPADPRQQPNAAGGFTFVVDEQMRLRRFLTLGVDGGTYYATAPALALDNARFLADYARQDPQALVDIIVEISTAGRAPRQQPALFALAYAASVPDAAPLALAALPQVARTGTHLLQFAAYVEQFRGWGRGLRRAVGDWYLAKPAADVAYQAAKYRQREGWSQRDLLRLAHPRPLDPAMRATFDWMVRGAVGEDTPALLTAYARAQESTDVVVWTALVREHRLSWEMLPDAALGEAAVWEALLENGIPQTALMRQLPRLTRLGLLPQVGGHTDAVVAQLTDSDRLRRARVHPVNVLVAQRTYASGRSARGAGTWEPTPRIADALDAAFYAAFGAVEPSGRRLLLAVDVSGSMNVAISGLPLTARVASAALTLVQLATEPGAQAVGFTSGHPDGGWHDSTLQRLRISPRQRLDHALRVVDEMPMSGTDCALPMLHATRRKLEVDTFVVYTDNETWAGGVHPHQALADYRQRMGIPARLVVVGMTATQFSIADPSDPGMLDVAGFDSAVPQLISDFARVV